jgi:hypothetical protein
MTNLQSVARLGSFGSACLDTHAQLEVGDHHSDPPWAKPLENSAGVTCQLLSIHPVSYYGAQPGLHLPRCACVFFFYLCEIKRACRIEYLGPCSLPSQQVTP